MIFSSLGLVVVLAFPSVAPAHHTVDRVFTKLALSTFGRYVDVRGSRPDRERLLEAAYIGTPYRVYESITLFVSALAALAGSVVGTYLVSAILVVIPAARPVLVGMVPAHQDAVHSLLSPPALSPRLLFGLLVVGGATSGTAGGLAVYRLRWWLPEVRAHSRRRHIELGTPSVIAFMYALSRGGLELPRILAILRRHRSRYGEAAAELAIAAKAINGFGVDTVAALRDVSDRTPSDQFRIFTENLASVLHSGRSVPAFLSDQYEQYQEEAEEHQELFLDRLGVIAEAYVAVFVVGPLFLLTVLLIFGLISGGTERPMAVIIYGVMPVINLGFIHFLERSTQPFGTNRMRSASEEDRPRAPDGGPRTAPSSGRSPSFDTGGRVSPRDRPRLRANFERLAAFDRVSNVRRTLQSPLSHVRRRPLIALYVTGPLAILWLVGHVALFYSRGSLTVTAVDDVFVQSSFMVLLPFAAANRYRMARIRTIEQVVPDMFNRLASLNQAGVEVIEAFEQVRHGDLGPLNPELDRLWIDVQFGRDLSSALRRFERRTQVPSLGQAVTLISHGLVASGTIGPVLRIAADESRRRNVLKRQRQQEMSVYLIIIYLAFLVFLTIVFVLIGAFIPAIPSQEALDGAGLSGSAAGITQEQAATFTVLLFHASLVQAVFSGLVAGQMSRGSIRDGAPHVATLMGLAYVLFALLA